QQRHRHRMLERRAASHHARSKSSPRRPRNSNKSYGWFEASAELPEWIHSLPGVPARGLGVPRVRAARKQTDKGGEGATSHTPPPPTVVKKESKVVGRRERVRERPVVGKRIPPKHRKAPPLSDELKAQLVRELEVEARLRAKINKRRGMAPPPSEFDV
ncbi:MAG: hypothetical protein SGPRY_011285, partial [Prymnesium sp.]